jgi:hypothetical protein
MVGGPTETVISNYKPLTLLSSNLIRIHSFLFKELQGPKSRNKFFGKRGGQELLKREG